MIEFKRMGKVVKLVVVGGRPAGMQTAILLSKRGFDVTLFEKRSFLGGSLLHWWARK